MSTVGLEPTQFISQGYYQHAFNCLGYIKKQSDRGTRTNVVFFCEGYSQHAFKCLGYIKKYADSGTRTNVDFFEGYCQHAFKCLGYIKKYADSGTRTNIVCFRRLLLARVQLPGLHEEISRQWDSNQHSLFPKTTASTRSTAQATLADCKNGTVRSTHPTLTAKLASQPHAWES